MSRIATRDEAEALRRRAWRAAGIDAHTARRFAREHQRLRPSAEQPQRADEVLDLDERTRLMRGIAAFYGELHAAAPDRFVWAGFAAIAVNDGVRPTTALARTAARLARAAAQLSGALGGMLAPIGHAAEDGLKCAFHTNYAIFADLGWVHLVFLDGGIDALRRLHRSGELDGELLDGFEDIARGARLGGDAGDALILRGNLTLFRHEQHRSATPIFARYGDMMRFATRVGLIAVPNRRLAARAAQLGRRPAWRDASESYGPFGARWRWLVAHAWEPLVALDRDRRRRGCRQLEREVARAVAGRPEGGGVLARLLHRA